MQRWIPLPGAPEGLPGDFSSAWDTLRGEVADKNRLRHVERVDRGGTVFFVKFFHRPRFHDLARNLLTHPKAFSQAEREVKVARLLEEAGLRAVPMAAYGEERFGPFERRSLLVTVEVKGPTLGEALRKEPGRAASLASDLEDLLEKLLRGGIYLPDLSLEHILLPPGEGLVLLDLHNARKVRRWTRPRLAGMLGRLWAGARDTIHPFSALRFAGGVLGGLGGREFQRAVLAETARRGERWEKREKRKRPEERTR